MKLKNILKMACGTLYYQISPEFFDNTKENHLADKLPAK